MAKNVSVSPSELYHVKALDCFKGMAWFVGLGYLVFPENRLVGGLLVGASVVCMTVGCVLYVFSHQARMMEAEDQKKALAKVAAEP